MLPAEIMSLVFSYLPPEDLLEIACVSKAWSERVMESRLWKVKYISEGWVLDMAAIERYEFEYNKEKEHMSSTQLGIECEESQAKRATAEMTFSRQPLNAGAKRSGTTNGILDSERQWTDVSSQKADCSMMTLPSDKVMMDPGADENRRNALNHEIDDPSMTSPICQRQSSPPVSHQRPLSKRKHLQNSSSISFRQPLMLVDEPGYCRVNYHHIFKQKRKLEDNWDKGRYKSFQLPHRDYPQDAHEECVYTIQYQGNFLVSGSRDRTLRIWDLETGRLAKKPLRGHVGSVLCLQFDSRPEEDILISGSSDTNVILWRFSTGKMIKKIASAHRESVLNLRFDHRFVVTCSKDKTIKIWNRRELRPGDKDYPLKGVDGGGDCPAHIIDAPSLGNPAGYHLSAPEHLMLLEPYTHLMTLELHGAAVNAIQIYKDQLVSASGDRHLRVWNIHTGECHLRIQAHEKGIACVQYDGKRIVSGSSDNTIRIWDPITKAEVARLEGHTRLVRTLQAAFADLPGGRERLEVEAAEVDRRWLMARDAGEDLRPNRPGRPARPGSRRPRDLRARGAKIPPSGGGSRWARIISGSYDEKVIIWKKNSDDEWVISHQLAQEEALTAAGPPLFTRSQMSAIIHPDASTNDQNQPNAIPAAQEAPPSRHALHATQAYLNALDAENSGHIPAPRNSPSPQNLSEVGARPSRPVAPNRAQNNVSQQVEAHHPTSFQNPLVAQNQNQGHYINTVMTAVAHDSSLESVPPHNSVTSTAARPPAQQNLAPAVGQPNARVFKLQFDARRIICCSQDNKIVGWDFADGDEQIIACSKFFADPQ